MLFDDQQHLVKKGRRDTVYPREVKFNLLLASGNAAARRGSMALAEARITRIRLLMRS